MSAPPGDLDRGHKLALRLELAAARAAIEADAEGFIAVARVVERVGRALLGGSRDGLGGYHDTLVDFVRDCNMDDARFERSLFLLREARNDRVHTGGHARQVGDVAKLVALLLEEALSLSWQDLCVRDVMVRNVVVAQPCETVGDVRERLLQNAFTAIPYDHPDDGPNHGWWLLTDHWVACRIAGHARTKRRKELDMRVVEALRAPPTSNAATPTRAVWLDAALKLHELRERLTAHPDVPLFLVRESSDSGLAGVISPSDLL